MDLAQRAATHGIRPGLERIEALLEALGQPQRALRVVHVAGTNGKGSVCALLTSALREAGLKVARYSSPHLISYVERFWFDGQFISEREFETLLARVSETAAGLDPALGPTTEFELLTAVGMLFFASRTPDLVVLEVGLGGRLDATNVFAAPELCVITRIALDHQDYLGTTLEEIAREKAGILKPGVPAIVGALGVSRDVITRHAASLEAPVLWPTPHDVLADGSVRLDNMRVALGLAGTFQPENAAIAHAALLQLRRCGWEIPDRAIEVGFARAAWPGRFQQVETPDGQRYCFDGAHNPDGVEALVASLETHAEPRVMVVGMLRDKPHAEMIRRLAPLAETLILTTPPSARALSPAALGAGVDHPDRHERAELADALALAAELAGGRTIVVAGSLYLVGAAMKALGIPVRA